MSDFLSQLNPEQADAAGTVNGPVLVLAGAGTGKTRVITFRIAHMLSIGIPPEQILGMTFTNKAAREMRERLAQLVDPKVAARVTLGTFHSFCIRILRREAKKLGYLPGFTIADDSDQQGLLKQAAGAAGCNTREGFPLAEVQAMIGKWKNRLLFPADAKRFADNGFEEACATIYEHYQELLELQNSLDFDDMLLLVHKLFSDFPDVLAHYQDRYRYLLIDEYQDTNAAQFTIVKMLIGERRNLCVVGDDDQSIYSWRGADISKIVTGARTMDEQVENLKIILMLKKELQIPFLFLCGGQCGILRRIGGELGCCMYLCVHEHDGFATPVQPLLRDVKTMRELLGRPAYEIQQQDCPCNGSGSGNRTGGCEDAGVGRRGCGTA